MVRSTQGSRREYNRADDLGNDTEKLRQGAEDLLQHTLSEFKTRSEDIKSYVTEYVKEQPFKSLGIAVGIGAVLALLLKR